MSKSILLILIVAIIGVITIFSGCQAVPVTTSPATQSAITTSPISSSLTPQISTSLTPQDSISPAPQNSLAPYPTPWAASAKQLMTDVISAMSQVKSVKIDNTLTDLSKFQYPSSTGFSVTTRKEENSIDIQNNKMYLSLNIDTTNTQDDAHGHREQYDGWIADIYYDSNFNYGEGWEFGTGHSPSTGPWHKSKLPEGMWTSSTPLSPILELLKSANQFTSLSKDKINGKDCQVINFIPSVETVADWIMSYDPGFGPSLIRNPGGPITGDQSIIGKTMYIKAFKKGIFQIWIDNDTHLIIKAVFAPHFEATFEATNSPPQEASSREQDFLGQLFFSNYNQPLNIQIPDEALNAK